MIGSALLAPAPAPALQSLPGEAVSFQSQSGSTLCGNLIRNHSGKGGVVLMHGVRGNRQAMAGHATFLAKSGFTVLFFDFQAHGESAGKIITNGYLESFDAAAAVDFLKSQIPGEKIVILGSSLGGAAAVLADPPLAVDGMILEMVYPDLERAVKNRIAMVCGDRARPLSFLLTWQTRFRIGVPTDWFSPANAIVKVKCPKLLIAGKQDRHTTFEDTQVLFSAALEPKELWLVENAAHENLRALAEAAYDARIIQFLERCLK